MKLEEINPLVEKFDKILKFKGPFSHSDTYHEYVFTLDDLHYTVRFVQVNTKYLNNKFHELIDKRVETSWEISFGINRGSHIDHNITGTGNSYEVFSTILEIIRTHLSKQSYLYLIFAAEEPSRRKLYDRFVKTIVSKLGYKSLGTFMDSDGLNYLLERISDE